MEYKDYLQTEHWKTLSIAVKKKVGKCMLCGSTKNLNVHHNNYRNLGHELPTDLIVLCEDCHHSFHTKAHIQKTPLKKDECSITFPKCCLFPSVMERTDLPLLAKVIYCRMLTVCKNGGDYMESNTKLAQMLGVSVRGVQKSLVRLSEVGLIDIETKPSLRVAKLTKQKKANNKNEWSFDEFMKYYF